MSAPEGERSKRLMAKPVTVSDLLSAADWLDMFEDATGEDDDEAWSAWRVAAMLRKEAERRDKAASDDALARRVLKQAGQKVNPINMSRARRLLREKGLLK